jgi:hypothetical protein
MTNEKIYPDAVEEQLDYIMSCVKDLTWAPPGDDYDLEIHNYYLRQQFGEHLLQKWIDGNEEVMLTEDSLIHMVRVAMSKTILHGLQDKGFIDTVDDGQGNEYVFLTSKGKELVTKPVNDSLTNVNNIIESNKTKK